MLLNNSLSVIHLHCQAKAQAYHDRWSSIIRDSGHRPSGMSTSCMAGRSPCVLFSIIIWCRDVLFICCLLHLSKCREGEELQFSFPCCHSFSFYSLALYSMRYRFAVNCFVIKMNGIVFLSFFFFFSWIFYELYLICLTIRVSFLGIRVTW